ncbi:MAG: class I SAM-dependent methyltransferase [Phycisphaerales bacterium]|nr:class I SAM-dependent methyltransferase [Phycisphaerales bacterium]
MTRKAPPPKKRSLTAATADRHDLYERAVQSVEAEIDFVDRVYRRRRGRPAVRLREDFCGTGNTSCEWVRRRPSNLAFGLDIDQATLDWGRARHVAALKPHQQQRVCLLRRDVLRPGDATGMDCILAMNFSYWVFHERAVMKRYFESVRASLAPGGLFFLDFYGGSEAFLEIEEKRRLKGFTYVWEQERFNPIDGRVRCHIHFDFPDGTRMKRAFTYDWRVWTLPEIRDLLVEAGFGEVTVYWEGDDGNGGGNGIFRPTARGDACESFICYVVAGKSREH